MKKKIKVLQVIPKLGYGGAETGCYDLAHFLSEQNCKSYILTSGGELLKFIKKEKVKVFKLPVQSKNPILILFNALLLSLIIFVYNINIVHARSRAPAWSCLIATKITARKFVTTFHGTYNFNNSIILRPSIVFGPEDKFFNQFAALTEFFPALPLIGGGLTYFQPIYVGDVVKSIVTILEKEEINKNIYEKLKNNILNLKESDWVHKSDDLLTIK